MNANELADELTKMFRGEEYDRLVHEIPYLLRQQQAEIEALKAENKFFKDLMSDVEILRKASEK